MTNLDPRIARRVIDAVGGNGIPPEYGLQFFTAGLEPYLRVIREEYLSTFIPQGGSAFKMVVGVYGGGKTHFLYSVRDCAWENNFAVSYVPLSPTESPFYSLEKVYSAIVGGLTPPLSPEELLSGYERGVVSFLRSWVSMKSQETQAKGFSENVREVILDEIEGMGRTESISFANATKAALRALLNGKTDDFLQVCQWLNGEAYDRKTHGKHGILERIDRTTAFRMIRSLVQWVREIGYSGLVILLDEAERTPSLSSRQREQLLTNLREVIDACGRTNFQNVFIFYAVPDENFLEGRTQVYEALKQRVDTIFDELNPTGVKIKLEELPLKGMALLEEIGQKLKGVYEVAYGCRFEENVGEEMIRTIANEAYNQRYGDIGYKRLFVQKLVQAFHFLRAKGQPPSLVDLQLQ